MVIGSPTLKLVQTVRPSFQPLVTHGWLSSHMKEPYYDDSGSIVPEKGDRILAQWWEQGQPLPWWAQAKHYDVFEPAEPIGRIYIENLEQQLTVYYPQAIVIAMANFEYESGNGLVIVGAQECTLKDLNITGGRNERGSNYNVLLRNCHGSQVSDSRFDSGHIGLSLRGSNECTITNISGYSPILADMHGGQCEGNEFQNVNGIVMAGNASWRWLGENKFRDCGQVITDGSTISARPTK